MSDPPISANEREANFQGDGRDGGEIEQGEEDLIHVKEGYFKYIEIMFEWHKYMNPWQKNAVKALLNGDALTHPDHPLHVAGQDGIELYISTAESGKQNLLFSLKQIEYLQYYIHHYRLADPRVVKELQEGKGWPENCDFDSVKVEEWIPIPMNVLQPAEIGTVEPIVLPSLPAIKREMHRITRHNKRVKREAMMMRGTPQEKNKAEAEIDNEREGPGLRKGPMKHSWQTRQESEKPNLSETWAKGWDDEPVAVGDGEKGGDVFKVDPAEDQTSPSPVPSDGTSEPNSSRPPSTVDQVPDTPSEHYHHAQQALLLASQGGLVTALANRPDAAPEGDPTEAQAKIGRSLFISLDLVTWEQDENVILEIGWSAVWFQPQNPEEPHGDFEEMTSKGHYIVQDHSLQHKNGDLKPNHRDDYLFGSSLPIKATDIASTVERLISDLSTKAGGGPTYMVLHSPISKDADGQHITAEHAKFIQLGLYSVDWVEWLRPVVSKFPPYADEAGLGQTFIIDTAKLFGNIENGSEGAGPGKTSKSLDDVALIMFGASEKGKPTFTANAGNRASYTMDVFLSIVTGPDLKVLQEDYKQSQTPVQITQTQAIDELKTEINKEPITFVRPEVAFQAAVEEDLSDSDEDGIKGVYFEGEDGELAEYEDHFRGQ